MEALLGPFISVVGLLWSIWWGIFVFRKGRRRPDAEARPSQAPLVTAVSLEDIKRYDEKAQQILEAAEQEKEKTGPRLAMAWDGPSGDTVRFLCVMAIVASLVIYCAIHLLGLGRDAPVVKVALVVCVLSWISFTVVAFGEALMFIVVALGVGVFTFAEGVVESWRQRSARRFASMLIVAPLVVLGIVAWAIMASIEITGLCLLFFKDDQIARIAEPHAQALLSRVLRFLPEG